MGSGFIAETIRDKAPRDNWILERPEKKNLAGIEGKFDPVVCVRAGNRDCVLLTCVTTHVGTGDINPPGFFLSAMLQLEVIP